MKLWLSTVWFVLTSLGVAQAQTIECTFLNRQNGQPLYRWTVKLGPKPYAHRWYDPNSFLAEDEDREVTYVKHAKTTNTAIVLLKSNYKNPHNLPPEKADFDDTVLLINFGLNTMTETVAEQATDPEAKAGKEPHRPVNFMDACKRLD